MAPLLSTNDTLIQSPTTTDVDNNANQGPGDLTKVFNAIAANNVAQYVMLGLAVPAAVYAFWQIIQCGRTTWQYFFPGTQVNVFELANIDPNNVVNQSGPPAGTPETPHAADQPPQAPPAAHVQTNRGHTVTTNGESDNHTAISPTNPN